MFGNTEQVARAIADGLRGSAEVEGELDRAKAWGRELAESIRERTV